MSKTNALPTGVFFSMLSPFNWTIASRLYGKLELPSLYLGSKGFSSVRLLVYLRDAISSFHPFFINNIAFSLLLYFST